MNEHSGKDDAAGALQKGFEFLQSGAHEPALAEFTRAEERYAAAGDGQRQARTCTNKALVMVQLRRLEEALDGFRAALRRFEEGDEFIRAAEQYGNIGSVHRDLEQPDEALESYADWQRAMFRDYPAVMSGARPPTDENTQAQMTSFATYARGELETYSERTLKLLHRDLLAMQACGESLSEKVYDYLERASGYASLKAAEGKLKGRGGVQS